MAHTPGPWKVIAGEPDRFGHPRAVISSVLTRSNICNLYVGGRKFDKSVHDDANLIAAAPDLLEACKAILKAFQDGEAEFTKKRESDSDPYHPANVKLYAAIAKAEGV